jgi:uncharacterized membrane protein YkoI
MIIIFDTTLHTKKKRSGKMIKKTVTMILLFTLFSLNLFSVNAQGANPEGISMEKAKEIALKEVQGEIVNTQIEKEDGMDKYEIIIQARDGKYEVEIDKATGKVLEVEKEDDSSDKKHHDDDRDDDDDRHDDDDDHDDLDEPNDD